jgi:hypothetical protein
MKLLQDYAFVLVGLVLTGVLLPLQAYAMTQTVSLALLAVGAAGVGAAA